MTDKYNILKTEGKSGSELTITFRVEPDKAPPFESSINVPHNTSEESIIKRINDVAYNQLEHNAKKKEKEDKNKADKENVKNSIDKLKKDIDKLKDTDVDITEPDDE